MYIDLQHILPCSPHVSVVSLLPRHLGLLHYGDESRIRSPVSFLPWICHLNRPSSVLPQQMLIFAHFRLFDPLPGFSLSIGARNSSIGRYYRLQVRYGGLEGFGMGFGDGLMC